MSLSALKSARALATGRPWAESATQPADADFVGFLKTTENGRYVLACDTHLDALIRLADAVFAIESRLAAKQLPLKTQRNELLSALAALK